MNVKSWTKNGVLYAETTIPVQILSLFSYCRRIKVYQQGRFIKIETRWLWFLTTQKYIPFSRILQIETESSTSYYKQGRIHYEFSIFLRLQNPYEHYRLIGFDGVCDEGVDLTGWQQVLLGNDNIISERGDQETTFQYYYRLLKEFVESNRVLK